VTDSYVHGYATEEQRRLLQQAEHWRDDLILAGTTLQPGTRLLEVGCGVGAVLGVLGQAFPGISINGVDIEERQIETARTHLAALGLNADLRRADALDLPYPDESFDHVWMMWFLEHVADPVGALREARRVLVPGGTLTAIEVDYNTVWASPTSAAFEALVAAVAGAMDAAGRSDTGTLLPGWLEDAAFAEVDPGERPFHFTGAELTRQATYAAAVIESTIPALAEGRDDQAALLTAGLEELRGLPSTPDAALGWVMHKARATR
jgi:SAM-dependent methyltransferase